MRWLATGVQKQPEFRTAIRTLRFAVTAPSLLTEASKVVENAHIGDE
jgi:hypothetical protein